MEVKECGFVGSGSEVVIEGGLGGLELGFGEGGVIRWGREGRGGHVGGLINLYRVLGGTGPR